MLSFFFSQVESVFSGTPRSLAMVDLDFSPCSTSIMALYFVSIVLTFNLRLTPLPPNADFALGVVSSDLVIPPDWPGPSPIARSYNAESQHGVISISE